MIDVVLGRATLDLVELLHVRQEDRCARISCVRDLGERAPCVRPAAHFDRASEVEHVIESRVCVGLEPADAIAKHRSGSFLLPVGRVLDRAPRRVADVEPHVPALAAARCLLVEHLQPRVVGGEHVREERATFDLVRERRECVGDRGDPVDHRRDGDRHAEPLEDRLLPRERVLVLVLADDDLREQLGSGAPLLDDLVRHGRDHDSVLGALLARELLARVLLDHEAGRDEVQDLTRLVADALLLSSAELAASLGLGHQVRHRDAPKVGRQRLATVPFALGLRRGRVARARERLGRRRRDHLAARGSIFCGTLALG